MAQFAQKDTPMTGTSAPATQFYSTLLHKKGPGLTSEGPKSFGLSLDISDPHGSGRVDSGGNVYRP